MQEIILQFQSLVELAAFSRTLNGSYRINTANLTLTAAMSSAQRNLALKDYGAATMTTTEKAFAFGWTD